MRKILSFLVLALFMTVTAGANGTKVGDLYYLFDGTNATVTYPGDAQPTSGNNAYTGAIDIPATVTHDGTTYNVTAIGDFAFQYSTVTSLTMHEGLLTIGRWSISNISTITEITIPNSVTALGAGVSDPLSGNSNLKTIVLGSGLTSIGQGFLYSSSNNVTDIYFNAQVAPSVGGYFCNGVNKSTINIHVKETAVNSYMKKFNSYGIGTRIVGDIADDTPFVPLKYTYDTSAKTATVVAPTSGVYNRSITIPETVEYNGETYTVTTIGSGAFGNSLITSLTIPETVTRIEGTNFNNVCLKELRIPNSVTYISGSGDSGAGAVIPTIYIGSGIKTISGSFMYDAAVSNVYIYAVDPPSTGTYSFSRNPTIHIYEGRLSAYKAVGEWAKVWSNDRNIVDDIEKDYYTYDEFLAKKTELEGITPGEDPGRYSSDSYANVETALSATSSISRESTTAEITSAMRTLLNAERGLVLNGITEGYYFIVSAGNGCGYYTGSTPPATNYNYEDKNALYNDGGIVKWKAFYRTDKTQVYKFTANGSNWNVFNLADETYINNTTGSGSGVSTSETAENAQKFTLIANGNGKYTITSTNYCYSLNGSHNGSSAASGELKNWGTTAEATKFGVNVWYIHKLTDEEVEDMFALRNLVNTINSEGTLNTITPKDHHDNKASLNRSFLLGNERTSIDGLATSTEHLAELQTAYDAATAALAEGKEKDDVPEVYAALVAAKAKVDAKSNPLVDGYYHLIAEYDYQTDGVPGGFVIEADGDGIKKIAYNANEPKQMFKVEYDAANGKVYLQNVANEKYLGVVDGSAWKFSTEKIALNVMTGNDHYWYHNAATTVAARSCSFILSDDAGKGISSTNCGVANDVTNTSSQAWTISWAFRPADDLYQNYIENQELLDVINGATASLNTITPKNHHDNNPPRSFLLGNERTSVDGLATSTEHLAELQTALDALNAAVESGKTYSELTAEIAAVNAAKAKVDAKSNPLVDGYYHLVAEFDGGTDGIPGGFVIEADGDGIKKIDYNANEPKQMFRVEYDAANGKVYFQNVANGKYLGVVDGSAWKFSDDRISLNVMTGNDHNWFWGADRTVAARSCSFILYDTAGKGINSSNCGVRNDVTNTSTEAWLESWAFRPADEYYADYIANGPLKTAIENLADAYANLEYGTNPGEYAQAGVEAFQNLYASDVTAYNGGNNTLTIAEQQAMADALSAAYQTAINTRVPLTDGYYVIKSAASAFGANEYAMYIDNNGKVAWKAYDAAAPGEFIFQLTDQNATVTPDGVTYEVFSYYNLYQQKYIGQCSSQMANEDASTSDEVWGACAQVLTPAGQFAIQPMWNPTTVSFCLTVDNTSSTSGIIRTSGWYGGYSGGNNNGSWKFEKVDLEAVTIGATGYSTYVSDKDLIIPEGVTANGVTGLDGSDVELTQLSGNVLAADEPVILQGEAGKKFYFIASDDAGNTIAGNLLEGTGTEGKSIGANEAYVLYNNQGTAVFRIAGAMTLPAHKAYLPAGVVNGAGAKEFGLGGLTGINNAQTSNLESQTYFDLQGRKVAAPQKGQLYIVNGKKVLY